MVGKAGFSSLSTGSGVCALATRWSCEEAIGDLLTREDLRGEGESTISGSACLFFPAGLISTADASFVVLRRFLLLKCEQSERLLVKMLDAAV